MDFELNKTQLLQRELFRKFAEEEVKPLAKEMDEAEELNPELIEKMKKLGFFGIPFGREYGGEGRTYRAGRRL